MPEPTEATDDKFVEVEGQKYQEDPNDEGQPLLDEEGKKVPFEEKDEEDDDEDDDDDDDKEPAEPTVRRSAQDHIIQRLQKKKKKTKKDDEEEEDDDTEDVEDGEHELTAAGRKAIAESVAKEVAPVKESLKKDSDEGELQAVLSDEGKYPGAKKLEKQIRKYMEHPAYANVAVAFIYQGLAAQAGISQAEKEELDEEGNKTKVGGHTKKKKTKSGSVPDVTNKSLDEIRQMGDQVMTGQNVE